MMGGQYFLARKLRKKLKETDIFEPFLKEHKKSGKTSETGEKYRKSRKLDKYIKWVPPIAAGVGFVGEVLDGVYKPAGLIFAGVAATLVTVNIMAPYIATKIRKKRHEKYLRQVSKELVQTLQGSETYQEIKAEAVV